METMWILKGIGFAALGIAVFLLATYVVMRLWNWLVPSLFNGPRLRFVQALGLFFLARLLFGFGFGRGGYGYRGQHNHWRHEQHRVEPRPEKENTSQSAYYPSHIMNVTYQTNN
ncbi:hypothetical protein BN8_00343 [Fibrisoma limi BUZ 3]|uniref:Uncharacterized protein n=1 Tax=Fibrisoma limi BUZ 3 TaxID=1185876 RepID=I2GBZ6_9BACT|nr:hypothetical protein [Fibrisoma limi]CCH51420.1 hypothetical protein BN8_00343 [Fibrisoma limi BUZ 3]